MALFEPQVINNGNEEEIMLVRRSGRLKHRPPNRDNENHETIDLTLDDSEDEQVNDIDGVNGNVNGVELEGENVDIDVILDKESEQVDSVEKPVAKQGMKVNPDKMTEQLGHRTAGNVEGGNMDDDFVADKETKDGGSLKNVEARNKKEAKRGKGMKKIEHDREGKGKAGKRKMVPEAGKLGKRVADNQDGEVKDKDATAEDGQSTDDDFVSQQKAKIPKVSVSKKKTFTRKRFEQKRVVGSGAKKGKNNAGPSVGRIVNRVHLRNPPGSLFRVITEMADIQKKDVRSMGFGEVLDFKIKDIPTRLAYWLLDRFDENTCTLDVNGRSISITPELVKNMLGVPRGDVHIKAPDNADYRNPLTKKWKEQFGEGVKKHFPTLVAKEILEKKEGGWLFKLNFLVLFFSTIGELNLSNTVNLRFLSCINNEYDILKLDWCTYIIECLIRTKRSWNRNAHFNGPVILLLVVYATSNTAIKHWSSELLHKLEGDMFSKESVDDAAVDDRAVDEETNDFDEDFGWEDDVFEENGVSSVPENAEVMKKNVSSYLKRARELLDKAEEVIDIGLEDNPDDYGFVELKELRDQLCVPRKYSHKPEDNKVPTNEAYEKCFTPQKNGNQKDSGAPDEYVFPFTQVYGTPTELIAVSDEVCREWERNHQQIPTRLDFEDDAVIDLNVTQPPATQGKVVGDDMEEDELLPDSVREYVSQEPVGDVGFKTPEHPIPVRAHESNTSNRLSRFGRESMGNKSKEVVPVYPDPMPLNVLVPKLERIRAKRPKLLPEVLRSPYMRREVSLVYGISKHEEKVAECLFSARLPETDIVFKTPYVDGERVVLESMFPDIDIASGAIDLFTLVLNDAEKHRSKHTVPRLFCHTAMLTSEMQGWEYGKVLEKFVENLDIVVARSEFKTLDGVQLVFFPVIQGRHFFVVCMNMKDGEVQILDNLLLPNTTEDERFNWFILLLISVFEDYLLHKNNQSYEKMTVAPRKVLQLGCRTTNNFVDCGVFTMRHMETYKGDGACADLCGLGKEGKKQRKDLRELRIKYATKILLSECNLVKSDFDREVHGFRNIPVEEKKRLKSAAFETIKLRVSNKFEVK